MACPCLGGTGEWCGPCRRLIHAADAAKQFLDELAVEATGRSCVLTRDEIEARRRDRGRKRAENGRKAPRMQYRKK